MKSGLMMLIGKGKPKEPAEDSEEDSKDSGDSLVAAEAILKAIEAKDKKRLDEALRSFLTLSSDD